MNASPILIMTFAQKFTPGRPQEGGLRPMQSTLTPATSTATPPDSCASTCACVTSVHAAPPACSWPSSSLPAPACARLLAAASPEILRKALLASLADREEVQRRLKRALLADVPKPLRQRQQRLALDLILIPSPGQPEQDPAAVSCGPAKHGTSHCHAYASAGAELANGGVASTSTRCSPLMTLDASSWPARSGCRLPVPGSLSSLR